MAIDFSGSPRADAASGEATGGNLWRYLSTILVHPRRGFADFVRDPARLRLAFVLIGMKAAGYTVVVLLLHLGRMPIMLPAWISLPVEQYYLWQTFFIGAVTVGSWLLAAGVVQVLSRPCGGNGRFEDVVATTSFAIVLPSLATILPDLTVGTLTTLGLLDPHDWARISVTPGAWRTVIWGYLGLYLVGMVVLFPMAIAAAHRVSGWRAVLLGVIGAVTYQGMYFIFIR